MMMYAQDYDERFPNWRTLTPVTPDTPNGKITWVENMQPYCKNKKIWFCPSDADARNNAVTQNSYWLNAYVFRWSGLDAAKPPSATLAEIPYPASTILYCDGPANDGQHVWPGPPTEWCGTTAACLRGQERHSGGINFTFCDGHVKWYKVSQLRSTVTPDDSNTDTVPGLLGLGNRKRSNDGSNPWWRL